jgi:hypothetical protein
MLMAIVAVSSSHPSNAVGIQNYVLRNRKEWKKLYPISMCSIHSGNNSAYGDLDFLAFHSPMS